MSILTQPRRSVNAKSRKPVVAELTLTLNGAAYVVIPNAHAPGCTRSYRLVKDGDAEAVYDVEQSAAGLVTCTCPSYEKTYRGNGLETCKHGRALIIVGLCDYPPVQAEAPAFVHVPDEFDEPARGAYDDARETLAAIAEDEAVVRTEAEPVAPVAPAFDRGLYACQNAVAEGRALWLAHRHLHASGPIPGPSAAVSCCDDADPNPCTGCLTHDGPADLSDDGWDDAGVWTITDDDEPAHDDEPRSLVDQVLDHARELRAIGSPLHDLLAERAEGLAAEIRHFDAATVGQYLDRRDAALDCAALEAEAGMASRYY